METWAAAKKKLQARVAVPRAPIRVPNHRHMPRVSLQSLMSTNDKRDNDMIPGAVHRSRHFLYS